MFESGPMVSMLIRVHDSSIVMGKTLVVGGLIPNWEDAILVLFDIK
jgi:hypothetical protein